MRPEHPDPVLERDDWISLNGDWDFEAGRSAGKIQVPFPVEAEASGVQAGGLRFTYRRELNVPREWRGRPVFLRIGAADQDTQVRVNGRRVGSHRGGYTPMAFRIDQALRWTDDHVEIRIKESRKGRFPRGKQTHLGFTHTIFYKPSSGIWQPVWLECRGESWLERCHPVWDDSELVLHLQFGGEPGGIVRMRILAPDGKTVAVLDGEAAGSNLVLRTRIPAPLLWTPDTPHLYRWEAEISLGSRVVDRTRGYLGLRTVYAGLGRFWLNSQPFYQRLALYQPYYPQGWTAAVDDGQYRRDVELAKELGFNGIRIHQSLADPRLLYWCDRLGLMVWGELPSPFVFSRADRSSMVRMLHEMIGRDRGHPSIITWVLFNESWGVMDVCTNAGTRAWIREMVVHCRRLDPGRPVIDNSGFEHVETDVLDIHQYLANPERVRAFYRALEDPTSIPHRFWRQLYMLMPSKIVKAPLAPGGEWNRQPIIISECGGHGFSPYGNRKLSLEQALKQTLDLIEEHDHIQGYCYTQLFDVAQETNGLATFDRTPKPGAGSSRIT